MLHCEHFKLDMNIYIKVLVQNKEKHIGVYLCNHKLVKC